MLRGLFVVILDRRSRAAKANGKHVNSGKHEVDLSVSTLWRALEQKNSFVAATPTSTAGASLAKTYITTYVNM